MPPRCWATQTKSPEIAIAAGFPDSSATSVPSFVAAIESTKRFLRRNRCTQTASWLAAITEPGGLLDLLELERRGIDSDQTARYGCPDRVGGD